MDNRRTTYDGTLTKARDPLEIRSADAQQGILTGYASRYWVVDSYGEVTAPGSFAQTIAERGPQGANRILLRYEHEHTIGTHTRMAEDGAGLAIEAKVSDDGQWGSAVRAHLADGVPYGLSIGFKRVSDRTATLDDPLDYSSAPSYVQMWPREEIRVLTGVKLMENSVVSFPAVDPALIDGYRSDAESIADIIAALRVRKLTPDELSQLKAFIDAQPADGGAGGSETPPTTPAQTAQRRNYAAEFELLTGVKL